MSSYRWLRFLGLRHGFGRVSVLVWYFYFKPAKINFKLQVPGPKRHSSVKYHSGHNRGFSISVLTCKFSVGRYKRWHSLLIELDSKLQWPSSLINNFWSRGNFAYLLICLFLNGFFTADSIIITAGLVASCVYAKNYSTACEPATGIVTGHW